MKNLTEKEMKERASLLSSIFGYLSGLSHSELEYVIAGIIENDPTKLRTILHAASDAMLVKVSTQKFELSEHAVCLVAATQNADYETKVSKPLQARIIRMVLCSKIAKGAPLEAAYKARLQQLLKDKEVREYLNLFPLYDV